MIHSFYNAHYSERTILDEIVRAEISVRVSDNSILVQAIRQKCFHHGHPALQSRTDRLNHPSVVSPEFYTWNSLIMNSQHYFPVGQLIIKC